MSIKLVKDSYGAKTIKNYFGVIKMVVASAKDKATRKPLYPVAWDNDVLLMPRVNAKKQNRPTFTDKQPDYGPITLIRATVHLLHS